MKKLYYLFVFGSFTLSAQIASYDFSTSAGNSLETGTFTNLIGTNADDVSSAVTAIGFNFLYNGVTYTQFSACSNSGLALGGTQIDPHLDPIATYPLGNAIFGYQADMYTDADGNVQYLLMGAPGNRKLVVEYNLSWLGFTGTADKHFQIWLFENNSKIMIVYGSCADNTTFDIGLIGNTSADYQSVNSVTNVASTISYTNNTTSPASGRAYIFTNGENTWLGTTNTDWNTATNWSLGVVPTNISDVVITDVVNQPIVNEGVGTPATCNNLTVDISATLDINPTKALTVSGTIANAGTITLNSDATGTASLVNSSTISGAGTFNAEQYLTGSGGATPNGRRWYVSSPLTDATSACVNAMGTDKLFSYNEATLAYTEITTNGTTLNPTKGYVFRGGANTTETFTGTAFNTGNISTSGLTYTGAVANTGYNLVGNPYPSFFDWESATLTNVSTTYTIKMATGGGTVVNDTYNGTSHVGSNNNGGGALTKYIAPNQGFWSLATAGGAQIDFTNAGRSHQAATLKSMENSLIRLNLTNGTTSDQLVINANSNASENVEAFDSEKMFIGTISEIFAQVDEKQLIINSLPEITSSTVIPLSLKILVDGSYSFDIEEIVGLFSNFNVYIEDKQLETVYNLSIDDTYSFNAVEGESTGRFNLLFTDKNMESASLVNKTEIQKISMFNVNSTVHVNLNGLEKGEANVYDVAGRKVGSYNLDHNTNQFELQEGAGVYTVVVKAGNFNKLQKIVIQ